MGDWITLKIVQGEPPEIKPPNNEVTVWEAINNPLKVPQDKIIAELRLRPAGGTEIEVEIEKPEGIVFSKRNHVLIGDDLNIYIGGSK